MRSAIILLTLVSIAFSPAATAHFPEQQTLNVEGLGRAEVVPDTLIMDLHVRREGESPKALKREVNTALDGISRVLRNLGIPGEDINVNEANSMTPRPVSAQDQRAEIGHSKAYGHVRVTVRDLTTLPDVLAQSAQAGVHHVGTVRCEVADEVPYETALIEEATENAKERARAAAGAMGVTLGPVLNASVDVRTFDADEEHFDTALSGNAASVAVELQHPDPITIAVTLRTTHSFFAP